jgi:hypothetical protein
LRLPPGAGDKPSGEAPGSLATIGRGWLAAIFAASAVYAGAVVLFSGIGVHRQWAIIAAPAYVLAAVAAAWKRRGLDLSLLLGFAGGLVVPLTWMAVHGESQREIKVIIRSAWSLIHHGTPYHSTATLAATQNPDVFNPYLPVMALFGMARTVVGGGVFTDPRVWLGITFIAAFALALSTAGAADAWRWTALVTATPLVAFPLAVGGDDLPVLGLMCLGLALLWRPQREPAVILAGLTLGVAAAMKATAWPVLIVAVASLAARDGRRAVARFGFTALATFAVLVGPVFAVAPSALVENTILFPLGLSHVKSGAASPLPGYLLAQTGHAGHLIAVGLLALAGLALALSLVIRPPRTCRAATWWLIIGLVLMFTLAPASRFGYYVYPAGLWVWLQVSSLGRAVGPPAAASPVAGSAEPNAGAASPVPGSPAPAPPGPVSAEPNAGAASPVPRSRTPASPVPGSAEPGPPAGPAVT